MAPGRERAPRLKTRTKCRKHELAVTRRSSHNLSHHKEDSPSCSSPKQHAKKDTQRVNCAISQFSLEKWQILASYQTQMTRR